LFDNQNLPFYELGFLPHSDNLWFKYSETGIKVPHFVVTTTINPKSLTFIVKNLLKNKTFTTDSYDEVKDFVLSESREEKIKKILD
jgi:hypothetical protein